MEENARQPEILRAYMRDQEYKSLFHYYLLEAAEVFLPYRILSKFQNELKFIADFSYLSLTFSWLHRLTLGQEYGEIKPKFNPPSWWKSKLADNAKVPLGPRLLYTLATTLSLYLLRRNKSKYEQWAIVYSRQASEQEEQDNLIVESGINRLENNWKSPLRSWRGWIKNCLYNFKRACISKFLPLSLEAITSKIHQFHLALFFIFGRFYELSRRFSCLRYVFRSKRPDHKIKYTLPGRLLMFKLLFQLTLAFKDLCICLYHSIQRTRDTYHNLEIERKILETRQAEGWLEQPEANQQNSQQPLKTSSPTTEVSDDDQRLCSLCYNIRKNPSATQCGHLFCWNCILQSLAVREECPQCRAPAIAEKVVQLRNLE